MNAHTRLFGLYVPGDSPVHRWPVWFKYLLMFGVGLAPFVVGRIWFSMLALGVSVILLIGVARLPIRMSLGLPWVFWLMMAIVVAYHAVFTSWQVGVQYLLSLMAALYLARLVTTTTPVSDLMDAIASGARPLRFFGVNPERIALAVALMWRSIPYLIGSIGDVRNAARARGLEKSVLRFIVPVIVGAVGYALTTSDSLRARGLDDRVAD